MIVREAYRDRTHAVCREHYTGAKPLPADAPVLGPVQDARDGEECEFCRRENTHWGYGSGLPGCLFDNGPCFVPTRDDAIDGALFPFYDDLTAEEHTRAVDDLETNGIHYFPADRRGELGASLVQIWQEQGPCPDEGD